jgi:GTP-binding protein LepA
VLTASAAGSGYDPTVPGSYDPERIRNFCIIAHIDHGKSTLADRLLQKTGTLADREMQDQVCDTMDIERERGITIKLNCARMRHTAEDGEEYILNLIDTPGHVDFGYEVSRSLAACEGALLVVDASQGVEAQTIANVYLALEGDLEIVPILNKIDLPGADVDRVATEVENTIGIDCSDAIAASAKVGIGIDEILEAIVQKVPAPAPKRAAPLRALIFDSYYDAYVGVVSQIRVVDGEIRKGDKVRFMQSGAAHEVLEVGTMAPGQQTPVDVLRSGEVGYMHGGIKAVADARVGDTITLHAEPAEAALEGYQEPVPMVYCGLFPVETTQYQLLRESLEKLTLNDAALTFEPETSSAMGFGFRCGFLGLLHMEIVQERLEREYGLDLIVTAPSVVYKVEMNDGEVVDVDAPAKMADADRRQSVSEPYVDMEVFCPKEYTGTLMELAESRRGEYKDMTFLTEERVSLKYALPLAEVITDFFDAMKSRSKGYASMEYSVSGYRPNDLVRLDILIAGEEAPPLSAIVHRDAAHQTGKGLTRKLKELIPRQQFKVPIQAAIGAKIVASSAISPIRKDVLAKCYGGDISRKKKLLNKQAKGKKRMKAIGKVNVPQEAFMAVLNLGDD